jgi:Flp pilus assembly protein TadD
MTALVSRLEAAALSDKADAVKAERINALRMLATTTDPGRAEALRYTVAYAAWRVAFSPNLNRTEQIAMLEDADAQLTRLLETRPDDVEAMVLLGAVIGARIGHSPDMGMTLGMRSSQLSERAYRLAPANPRVLLVTGQGLFHTPPEYGGSVQQAEARFKAALAAFEKEPKTKAWPNWGRFDAHAWLGQALAQRGDKAGARAQYEAALTIAPASAWVRYALLPQVK